VGASRPFNAAIGCALFAIGLLSGPTVHAQSVSTNEWARDVFGVAIRDQKVTSDEDWPDFAALSYARQARSAPAPVAWAPQPMPAVDGINAKIDGYGGGGNHSNGFYGSGGSVSVPLAQQWGLQLDGDGGSEKGIGAYGGAGHLFWRDPSIGLLGAYGSYSHWNGIDGFGTLSTNTSRYGAEGEYYLNRWTLNGVAGVEMVSVNSTPIHISVPDAFFDDVSVSYYVTDDFKLSVGHLYTLGTHNLTLATEYGLGLGGGRMASLFAEGWIGERGENGVLAGVRVYFGQHDKSLIDRHRQDDPSLQEMMLDKMNTNSVDLRRQKDALARYLESVQQLSEATAEFGQNKAAILAQIR
jgi:hypothetical protein